MQNRTVTIYPFNKIKDKQTTDFEELCQGFIQSGLNKDVLFIDKQFNLYLAHVGVIQQQDYTDAYAYLMDEDNPYYKQINRMP